MKKSDWIIVTLVAIFISVFVTAIVVKNQQNCEEYFMLRRAVQTAGLTIVEADFVQDGLLSSSVQYIRLQTIERFIEAAKENNVTTVYFGTLHHSGIFPDTYWFLHSTGTIIALNR